jgi:hypothetical protein
MPIFNTRIPPSPPLLRLEPFKGINLSVTPTQLDDHRSPNMLNVNIDERGALNKRTGYERVYATSLGVGKINGLFQFRKTDGTTVFLLAHGTNLYTQSGSSQPSSIYSSLANSKVTFFVMNDKCYIMDGMNYLVYDGTTVSQVTGYIPTLTISRDPAGGGTPNEDFNLISSGFKDSFSADGTATVYQLSLTDLDVTTVTAEVNGTTITEGSGLTVDRSTGKVTFGTAPTKGTNNVIITAYKTISGFADRVKKCHFTVQFGGTNDTRVFASGNTDYPNFIRRSGLYDPTYWPENGFYKYSQTVKGFSKQYDYLVVELDRGKRQIIFELVNGEASFPSKPINDEVGTLATGSIQLIENNPISVSQDGVYMLISSNVRDERNVKHISEHVDSKLLKEANLQDAVSIDYDRKYWLAVNGNVYVFDYDIGEWYLYDNIPAACFIEIDGELYFGSSSDGILYRFKNESELYPYNDDGQPINAYWMSKYFTFGSDEKLKLVEKIFFSLRPNTRTSADLYYISNKKESDLVKSTRMDLMDFNLLDFSQFSFIVTKFPVEEMIKIKAKKITHFQLILKNDKLDESMGILSAGIKFQYQSYVK